MPPGDPMMVQTYVELVKASPLVVGLLVLGLVVRHLFKRIEEVRDAHGKELAELRDAHAKDIAGKDARIETMQREQIAFAVDVMEAQTKILTEQQGTMRQVEQVLGRVVDQLDRGGRP